MLDFSIDFPSYENKGGSEVKPGKQDNHRADAAIGCIIRGEIRYII